MATVIIGEQNAARLQEIARSEQRPVEDVIAEMITVYDAQRNVHETPAQPMPARLAYTAKLYTQARAYWRKINDIDRLTLTDEQLDEQFWCFDPEGIPRLKADQGTITLPEDGLEEFVRQVRAQNPTGEVEEPIDYRAILNNDFPAYLWRRMTENYDQPHSD